MLKFKRYVKEILGELADKERERDEAWGNISLSTWRTNTKNVSAPYRELSFAFSVTWVIDEQAYFASPGESDATIEHFVESVIDSIYKEESHVDVVISSYELKLYFDMKPQKVIAILDVAGVNNA